MHFTEVLYRHQDICSPSPIGVLEDLAQWDVVINAIGD